MRNSLQIFRAVAIAGCVSAASSGLAAGVFTDFAGSWKGAGRVSDIHGRTEPLTCRSKNSPSPDGIAMSLSLVCASDSYRVDFHTDLYTDGHALRGTWTESTRDASGNVKGAIRPNLITAVTEAPGFSANIVVHINGDKSLNVTLDAHGTNVNHVEVAMKQ